MTETAVRRGAKPAASKTTVREIEVGRGGKTLLDRLANARTARLIAEREEDPLKKLWVAKWKPEAEGMGKDDIIVVKAQGVVRGKITMKRRAAAVDLDLLLQAFPEAYTACVETEVYTPQFDPA